MKAAKKNTPVAKTAETRPAAAKSPSGDFLSRVDDFLHRNRKFLLGLAMVAAAIFGLMLFDGRMSFATDDSTYLHNAVSLLQNGSYPTFQGSLYPMVLALVITIAGYKLLLLKFCSLIFLLLQIWVYYKAFRGRIP